MILGAVFCCCVCLFSTGALSTTARSNHEWREYLHRHTLHTTRGIPTITHSILPHVTHASGYGGNERREHIRYRGVFRRQKNNKGLGGTPVLPRASLQGRLRTGLPRSFTCSISMTATVSPNLVALYGLLLFPRWSRGAAAVVCSPGFSGCSL